MSYNAIRLTHTFRHIVVYHSLFYGSHLAYCRSTSLLLSNIKGHCTTILDAKLFYALRNNDAIWIKWNAKHYQ